MAFGSVAADKSAVQTKIKGEPKSSTLGGVALRAWLRVNGVNAGSNNRPDYEKRDR